MKWFVSVYLHFCFPLAFNISCYNHTFSTHRHWSIEKRNNFIFILFDINWRIQPNAHSSIPLIVVRLIVPDFWCHIIWSSNICMSVGLRAGTNLQSNLKSTHSKLILKSWTASGSLPVQNTGWAKVSKLDCPIICQENVLGEEMKDKWWFNMTQDIGTANYGKMRL